jgi:branched-chain amino acid transport system substrate-binding protein
MRFSILYFCSLSFVALLNASCSSSSVVTKSSPRSVKSPQARQASVNIAELKSRARPAAASNPSAPSFEKLREQTKLGRWSEALLTAEDLASQSPTLTVVQKTEIQTSRVRALEALGAFYDSAKLCDTSISDADLRLEHGWFSLKANTLIESRLVQDELKKVEREFTQNNLKAVATFRLAEFAIEDRDLSEARSYFAQTINLSPENDLAIKARDRLEQIEAVRRVEPRTIGVILPLSGKHASVSQKTLRGITMGLGLHGTHLSNFKLAIVDSEANSEKARRGVEKLIKEDNVIAIIGGFLSKTVTAEAVKSNELGVPFISLSQKNSFSESSPFIFRNAITGERQVRELVKYSMETLKIKRFGVIFPNDAYGTELSNLFWDEVLARGGEITAAQVYSSRETDFRYPVQRLIGTFYIEDRKEEFKVKAKELSESKSKKSRTEISDDILDPKVSFDALFIPDSAKSLGQISAMLSFNNVRGVHLLGTNLWNNPSLARRLTNNLNPVIFADGWLNTDSAFLNSAFVKDYKNIFSEDPGLFEIQGYDSAVSLKQLISDGSTSRDSLARALASDRLLNGALGPLKLGSDQELVKPLVLLTVDGGAIQPVRSIR